MMNKSTLKGVVLGSAIAAAGLGFLNKDDVVVANSGIEGVALNAVVEKKNEEEKVDVQAAYNSLLDTIGYAEGADYNTLFGNNSFEDFSAHPVDTDELICARYKGKCQTAAGRYQFNIKTTRWLQKKDLLEDFTPESQDEAAKYLLKWKKVDDEMLVEAIKNKDLTEIYDLIAPTWASIPYSDSDCPVKGCGNGSSYWGQGGKSKEELNEKFFEFYKTNQLES